MVQRYNGAKVQWEDKGSTGGKEPNFLRDKLYDAVPRSGSTIERLYTYTLINVNLKW
jgi:hypothetical protein